MTHNFPHKWEYLYNAIGSWVPNGTHMEWQHWMVQQKFPHITCHNIQDWNFWKIVVRTSLIYSSPGPIFPRISCWTIKNDDSTHKSNLFDKITCKNCPLTQEKLIEPTWHCTVFVSLSDFPRNKNTITYYYRSEFIIPTTCDFKLVPMRKKTQKKGFILMADIKKLQGWEAKVDWVGGEDAVAVQ